MCDPCACINIVLKIRQKKSYLYIYMIGVLVKCDFCDLIFYACNQKYANILTQII